MSIKVTAFLCSTKTLIRLLNGNYWYNFHRYSWEVPPIWGISAHKLWGHNPQIHLWQRIKNHHLSKRRDGNFLECCDSQLHWEISLRRLLCQSEASHEPFSRGGIVSSEMNRHTVVTCIVNLYESIFQFFYCQKRLVCAPDQKYTRPTVFRKRSRSQALMVRDWNRDKLGFRKVHRYFRGTYFIIRMTEYLGHSMTPWTFTHFSTRQSKATFE